jgi:hypothetical protein
MDSGDIRSRSNSAANRFLRRAAGLQEKYREFLRTPIPFLSRFNRLATQGINK